MEKFMTGIIIIIVLVMSFYAGVGSNYSKAELHYQKNFEENADKYIKCLYSDMEYQFIRGKIYCVSEQIYIHDHY